MLQPNFTPFPILETDRLRLRRIVKEDAPELFIMRSDPEVMHFIQHRLVKTMDEVHDFLNSIARYEADGDAINWAITLKEDPTIKGNICIWQIQKAHYRGELGYLLHKTLHRRGIMQEAIQAVLDYGFNQLGLHSIEALVNPENTASVNTLERTGFVREGLLKESFCHNDVFSDTAIYGLLKKDFGQRN